MLDSDGIAIEYVLDSCSYSEDEQESIIKCVMDFFNGCDEKETCSKIKLVFPSVKLVEFETQEELFEIVEEYGEEWVCRVGNTAIIIKE